MIDEIRPFLPADVAVEAFEIGLHLRPADLRQALQRAIDSSDGLYDPIYLAYGLCGNALLGLVAKQSRLVVPKFDDCIEIFMGSRQARIDELASEPGTMFMTEGYIGDPANVFSEHGRMVETYGRERADRLMHKMIAHYTRLVYIRMPHAASVEADRAWTRETADRYKLRFVEMAGTTRVLQRMVEQDWGDDFVVAEPGHPLTSKDFGGWA